MSRSQRTEPDAGWNRDPRGLDAVGIDGDPPRATAPWLPEVSLVAPFFNETDNVDPFVDEVIAVLRGLGRGFEIVCVDDASTDDTRRRLQLRQCKIPQLRVITLAVRGGQSAALAAGIASSRGRLVALIDADLQNDPADLPSMIARLDGDATVAAVVGWRQHRQDTWFRRLSSRVGNRVGRLICGEMIRDAGCSLKVARGDSLRSLPCFRGMHRFLAPLIRLGGGRVEEVPVNHRPRRHGASRYGSGLQRTFTALRDALGVRWLMQRRLDLRGREFQRDGDDHA